MSEEWRPVDGSPGYEVSASGIVRSIPRLDSIGRRRNGIVLSQYDGPGGYRYVSLSVNGKRSLRSVAKIVADAFIPNPLKAKAVRHVNGCKQDNRASNLKWNEGGRK